jgi:hypothetical protein
MRHFLRKTMVAFPGLNMAFVAESQYGNHILHFESIGPKYNHPAVREFLRRAIFKQLDETDAVLEEAPPLPPDAAPAEGDRRGKHDGRRVWIEFQQWFIQTYKGRLELPEALRRQGSRPFSTIAGIVWRGFTVREKEVWGVRLDGKRGAEELRAVTEAIGAEEAAELHAAISAAAVEVDAAVLWEGMGAGGAPGPAGDGGTDVGGGAAAEADVDATAAVQAAALLAARAAAAAMVGTAEEVVAANAAATAAIAAAHAAIETAEEEEVITDIERRFEAGMDVDFGECCLLLGRLKCRTRTVVAMWLYELYGQTLGVFVYHDSSIDGRDSSTGSTRKSPSCH